MTGTTGGFICVQPQNQTGNVELQIIANAVFSQLCEKKFIPTRPLDRLLCIYSVPSKDRIG